MRLIRLVPLVIVAVTAPALLPAQGRGGGEPLQNLQVLPKDMPRNQVTAVMRNFAMGLGVRCEHCHAPDANAAAGGGRGGAPPLDYASDAKDEKKIAREMLKMVTDINSKYLPTTGRTFDEFNRVSCETCHHGLARPQTIKAAMALAARAGGGDSAVTLYRSLRTRYYGSGAYDFTELQLNEAGSQIAANPEHRAAAIAVLKLNLEFFPQSVPTMSTLANVSVLAGDTAGAVEVLTKALEIQPNNNQLRNLLQRIKPGS